MRFLTLFSLSLFLSMTAIAAPRTVAPVPVVEESGAFLGEVEQYLNQMHTARAEFIQSATGMQPQSGTLYLARPGRLRLEYAPPPNILLVSDGRSVVYHDRDLDQITYLQPSDLPISFLLAKTVNFAASGLDTEVVTKGNEAAVTVSKKNDATTRPVTFYFTKNPLKLTHWSYLDEQGSQVTVTLQNLQVNLPVRDRLFIFKNPRFGK